MIEVLGIQFNLGDDTTTSCMTSSHYKDPVSSCLTMDAETTSEQWTATSPTATPEAKSRHHHHHEHHDYDNVIENLALVNAMANLKDLILLIDGSTYKKSQGQEIFAETFERVFDKSTLFSATTGRLSDRFQRRNNRASENVMLELSSYQKSFEEYLTLFNAGVHITEFKALSKPGHGGMLMEYTVRAILKNGQERIFDATAIANPRNGKFLLVERHHAGPVATTTTTLQVAAASDLTIMSPPANIVSGQVPACPLAVRVACNYPTECQLSHQNVHPGLSNMLPLCPGETELLPTKRAGTVIKICLVAAVTTASIRQATSTTSPLPSSSSVSDTSNISPDAKISKANSWRLGLMPPPRRRHAILNGRIHRIDIQEPTTPNARVPYAGGVWLEELKQPQRVVLAGATGPVFMLHNKQDIPIALCIPDHTTKRGQTSQRGWASSLCQPSSLLNKKRRHHRCPRAYNIMGRNPMHEDDLPTTSQFYPWYRLETNNTNTAKTTQSSSLCTILIWNGNRYEPYMTTTPPLVMPSSASCTASETEMDHDHNDDDDDDVDNHGHDLGQQPQQQHQEEHYSHRFLFSSVLKDAEGLEPTFSYGYLTCKAAETKSSPVHQHAATTTSWDLTISPNVDPALMICVAVVTRELICN